MTKFDKLAEQLTAYFRENNLYVEAYATGYPIEHIEVEIIWGDWEHEHLRCDWLAGEFFVAHGLDLISIHTITTEEDGSDTYSAIRQYFCTERS